MPKPSVKLLVLLVAAAATGPALFGQKTEPACPPPSYETLRQDEDWSCFASHRAPPSDFFDPIKYVPLDGDGSVWVSFGGQIRERLESWNQFDFGAPLAAVHNDGFLLSRVLLHTDLHVGRHVRFFIQEKNALSTHRALVGGRRTSDVDELDVQNGFLDLSLPLFEGGKFTLRAGRQELLFGRQRFVGPSDWSNTRKIFDGFSGLVEVRHWNLTAFWTRPVKVSKYYFNHDDLNTVFFGLHATGKMPVTEAGLDLYWYGLRNRKAVYNGTGGHETRHTLGGHTYGKIHGSGFDYDLGGSYQFGSVGARDIHAFMLLDQLGYRFHQVRSTPRFYAGFDYASGSHTVGGDVGTFNQLFPTAHQTLGYTDIVGRQNIMDVNGGLSFNPTRRLTARLDGYDFWRASAIDALYDKRGAVVRPGGPDTSRKVGEELDLTFRYQLDRHSRVELGYNHFFPSTFIRESGPHQSVDFGYLGLQFTF